MTSQRALAIRIAYEVVEWQAGRSCGTDPATGDFHETRLRVDQTNRG